MRWLVGGLLAALLGCEDSNTTSFEATTTTTPSKPKNGGFSADLAKSIGSDKDPAKAPKDVAKDPSDTANDASKDSGKDASKDVAKDTPKDTSKDASKDTAKDTSKDVAKDTPKDTSKDTAKDTGKDASKDSGKDAAKDASKETAKDRANDPSRDPGAGSDKPTLAVGTGKASVPINLSADRKPVKPSAELAAIRLSLEPNWDRDVGEAGTISLVVKVPGKDDTRVFAFRYGYEDAKAPSDRDAYKKWLEDNKILKASLDRQKGPAWYLEGTDASGAPAFRMVVTYGGKKLVCGGSLYKDAASNQLGDIRDKTLIQAKEICETLQL